jgi:hypothetical protein
MDVRNIVCHDITNLYMYSNLTSYWTIMMANNRYYMLNEYNNLHIGQKTMVTLVYQMKTNKRPSGITYNKLNCTMLKDIFVLRNYFLPNRQFQLLVYACRGRWEVRYHIADNAEKIKMVAV